MLKPGDIATVQARTIFNYAHQPITLSAFSGRFLDPRDWVLYLGDATQTVRAALLARRLPAGAVPLPKKVLNERWALALAGGDLGFVMESKLEAG